MQHSTMHPSDSATALAREQIWAALLLAWVAAFSDAIGFLVAAIGSLLYEWQ